MNSVIQALLKAITMIPAVVQGVEIIHQGASGSTKKEIALQALTLASGVAAAIDSKDTETISAVSNTVGSLIDSTVSLFNQTGLFQPKPQAVTKTSSVESKQVLKPGDASY